MNAEVYPGKDGWRFRVKAGNGEILCTGESYVRRIDAESALKVLLRPQAHDVTVRDHGGTVVDHYRIGLVARDVTDFGEDLGPVYTGPFEDSARYMPPGADPNEPYPHPEDDDLGDDPDGDIEGYDGGFGDEPAAEQ